MHKKFVAFGLFGTVLAAVLIGICEPIISPTALSVFYELVGLCFLIFAIWGGILLLQNK